MRIKYLLQIVMVSVGIVCLAWWLEKPRFEEVFVNDSGRLEPSTTYRPQKHISNRIFSDREAFLEWQRDTRAGYEELLGIEDYRNRKTKAVTLKRSIGKKGIVREYFELHTEDGLHIPGVLQYPKGKTSLPAVLVIPGHTRPLTSGLKQVIEDWDSYQHAAASELATAGFVTIAIELRGFGMLGPPNYPEHKMVAYHEIMWGRTYKGLVLSDLEHALKHLMAQDFVDENRLGVTGASLGGELAVALGAIVPSVKAIAFSAYFAAGRYGGPAAGQRKQPHYCHIIPNIGRIMHKEDVFMLLAPRPVLGIRDTGIRGRNEIIEKELKEIWKLSGSDSDFELDQKLGGAHEFYIEDTINFFKQYL